MDASSSLFSMSTFAAGFFGFLSDAWTVSFDGAVSAAVLV
jgi:hypothetical protein